MFVYVHSWPFIQHSHWHWHQLLALQIKTPHSSEQWWGSQVIRIYSCGSNTVEDRTLSLYYPDSMAYCTSRWIDPRFKRGTLKGHIYIVLYMPLGTLSIEEIHHEIHTDEYRESTRQSVSIFYLVCSCCASVIVVCCASCQGITPFVLRPTLPPCLHPYPHSHRYVPYLYRCTEQTEKPHHFPASRRVGTGREPVTSPSLFVPSC